MLPWHFINLGNLTETSRSNKGKHKGVREEVNNGGSNGNTSALEWVKKTSLSQNKMRIPFLNESSIKNKSCKILVV